MTEYQIVMVRSPDLTEAERERRLREAFDVLFNWAEKRTAALDTVGSQDQDSGATSASLRRQNAKPSIP